MWIGSVYEKSLLARERELHTHKKKHGLQNLRAARETLQTGKPRSHKFTNGDDRGKKRRILNSSLAPDVYGDTTS